MSARLPPPLPALPALSCCHGRPLRAPLQATLLNACIIGGCNVLGTVVSLVLVDRVGRRSLLMQGGVQVSGQVAGWCA